MQNTRSKFKTEEITQTNFAPEIKKGFKVKFVFCKLVAAIRASLFLDQMQCIQ